MGRRRKNRARVLGDTTDGSTAPIAPVNDGASIDAPLPPAAATSPAAEDQQKQRERDDKYYDDYRNELLEMEHDAGGDYDKWILSLAGVALGFSLSVVKDFLKPASNSSLKHIGLLYVSWILFGLPLALIMLNLQLSYSAARKHRHILDAQYRRYDEIQNFWDDTTALIARVWRNKVVECFNWVSLISFLLGIVSLVAFIWCNVR